jgi:hypothetical protein
MVVGFDLHQNAHRFAMKTVDMSDRIREEAAGLGPFNHRRVVLVGRQHARRAGLGAAPDHLKQGLGLRFTVEDEVGVEDFMSAMLAVGLGEHHQLDIGRVALERPETLDQIVDLVARQGQAQGCVGVFDGGTTTGQYVDSL